MARLPLWEGLEGALRVSAGDGLAEAKGDTGGSGDCAKVQKHPIDTTCWYLLLFLLLREGVLW